MTTTLINIFTTAPENLDRLVALLRDGKEAWISKAPGFISSTLHIARDNRRVVICGQWRSADDIAAMRGHPEMPAYFERVKALTEVDAITCDAA